VLATRLADPVRDLVNNRGGQMYRGTNSAGVATLSPQQIARALGGEVHRNQALVPGPGHSSEDRSLRIKVDASAPDGFLVHSFAHDDPIRCKDYVREKLGLAPLSGVRRNVVTTSTNGSHRL
jgi:hypothetical protein